MNLQGNLIWLIFGGFFGGIMLCLTVVGIPWGLQCFKIAGLALWPFGKQVISNGSGTSCLSLFCTALVHICFGLLLFTTVIGIPFARQHFKLVEISLMPFGKTVK